MQKVDIKELVDDNYILNEYVPDNIIIVGKIDYLIIKHKYNKLDLSKVDCSVINYKNQECQSIKNHLLPNLLQRLDCSNNKLKSLPNLPNLLQELCFYNNQLTSFPDLPNSLQILDCSYNQITSLPNWVTSFPCLRLPNSLKELCCDSNQITSLPNLPDSLQELYCGFNQLTSLPNLPDSLIALECRNNQLKSLPDLSDSLQNLYCDNNKLTSLPDLPNSLQKLNCSYNQLTSLPEFKNKIKLYFNQDKPIQYIPYTNNIILNNCYKNKINIIDYPHNPITNQNELDQYMEYQLPFLKNMKKSTEK